MPILNTLPYFTGIVCYVILQIGDSMEIRVLEYFLAVAEAGSITKAAEHLHLTQPTLSRQIKELELSLGKELFIRGSRKITLTEDGTLLRKRAQEIVDLVNKTESEVKTKSDDISGDIYIGAAESDSVRIIIKCISELQRNYAVRLHIFSGDAKDTLEKLDNGLIDFALLLGKIDKTKYNSIKLPAEDTWGLLMKKDSPLAHKKSIMPKDLDGMPLILSRQSQIEEEIDHWLGAKNIEPNIVATYNLIYNASLMVDEGVGYALTLDKLINNTGSNNLIFTPLNPQLTLQSSIIWKKNQVFSKMAKVFLTELKKRIG